MWEIARRFTGGNEMHIIALQRTRHFLDIAFELS
jgi:hypothetical protein